MGKRGSKAQAAMEFFLTYGWAILIVTIAIAALVYTNVFNPTQVISERCVIRTDSGLFCQDSNAVVGTGIILRIKNVFEMKKVTINSIAATFERGGSSVSCTYTGPYTMEGEEIKDFTLGEDCTLESGDKIKADLIIKYRIGEGLNKTVTGTFVKVVP